MFPCASLPHASFFFFFNDTATTEIYTLSLHDALPISAAARPLRALLRSPRAWERKSVSPSSRSAMRTPQIPRKLLSRSEEHTSELQSRSDLVCRLLLEKKKNTQPQTQSPDMQRIQSTS